PMVVAAGRICQPVCGRHSGACLGSRRAAPLEHLWIAPNLRRWTTFLRGQSMGICCHHAPHFCPVWLSCLFLRACCPARVAYLEIRYVLGNLLPAGWTVRGISSARVLPIYARTWGWLLAGSLGPIVCFRTDSPEKRSGALAGRAGCRVDWLVLLP